MRTYSHALLTLAVADRNGSRSSIPATLGAVLPDLPVAASGAWLFAKRGLFDRDQLQREACAKRSFAAPDAALHSGVSVGATLSLYALPGIRKLDRRRHALFFLVSWAGHVIADALTHGKDARPLFWPLSEARFESPVSYWERGRGARLFTALEHAAVLMGVVLFLKGRRS